MLDHVFWPGVVSIFTLYGLVFLVGVWASRRAPPAATGDEALEELMLAGRSLPLWVALLTMTATWVGGGYINGTAETTFSTGLTWGGQAGLGYAVSLIFGGLFFARRMRAAGHATLIDPLEQRYGAPLAAVLMVPAVLAELFWSAAILVALGSTFGTVIGLDLASSIVLSAGVAIAYTVFGGLRAVAWTDVVQLFLILAGLALAIPFVVDAGGGWGTVASAVPQIGFGTWQEGVSWSDWTLLLMLGGIPWNVYFQRVLSSESPEAASKTSMLAGLLCATMAIPPMIIGVAAAHIDWSTLDTGGIDAAAELAASPTLVLPYVLRYAVPTWVGVLGLGAVSAAVMSSVDSSILSAASLVAWNGYRRLVNPAASADQVSRLVRALVVFLGVAATVIALTYGSVSALWYLCGDIVYCVLFPQLTLALFDPKANRIGAVSGLAVSVVLRVLGGDGTLGLPNLLFPDWTDAGGEFPFRTMSMLIGLGVALVVARATQAVDPAKPL